MKVLTMIMATALTVNVSALDVSVLTKGASLGSGITEKQLPAILNSSKVYCARINGKNYLASKGAMTIFRKVATSRTKTVACNDKVKRQAMVDGIEVIQLGKSKLTAPAYKSLGQALIKAFGV